MIVVVGSVVDGAVVVVIVVAKSLSLSLLLACFVGWLDLFARQVLVVVFSSVLVFVLVLLICFLFAVFRPALFCGARPAFRASPPSPPARAPPLPLEAWHEVGCVFSSAQRTRRSPELPKRATARHFNHHYLQASAGGAISRLYA